MSRHHSFLSRDCPWCGDRLQICHARANGGTHFLGCLSYPRCSFTAAYDEPLHDLLACLEARVVQLEARLVRLEAQQAWLVCVVEEVRARLEEVPDDIRSSLTPLGAQLAQLQSATPGPHKK